MDYPTPKLKLVTKQIKWVAVVLTASCTVKCMMMVKKWFNIRNTVVPINAFLSKVAKQLAGTVSLLNTIRGQETVDISKNKKECMIQEGMTWHGFLIIIIYEVILLVVIALVGKMFKHVYRLCNFTNLQLTDKYVKKIAAHVKYLEIKVMSS